MNNRFYMHNIIFSLLMIMPAGVFAQATTDVWSPASQAVCKQISNAATAYSKGDLKNAHLQAVMSYFKGYDTDIEPAARITIGGPHVFAVERQFSDFSSAMTPHPSADQIKKVSVLADQLCKAVSDDAKILNESKVPRQVFKVNS